MYGITNNIAKIDGRQGIYDGKINNPSAQYGRNAVANYKEYCEDMITDKYPPLEFEYRYMPSKKLDKIALMGTAYEELGRKLSVKTNSLTKKLNEYAGDNQETGKLSAEAIDINKDGYVDISEYATSTLTEDILSSAKGFNINPKEVDGLINNTGANKAFALNLEKHEKIASEIYTNLYNEFNLKDAMNEFKSDKNNLI